MADLLDYTADDLNGKSIYCLVHAADTDKIKQTHNDCELESRDGGRHLQQCFISVIKKGQVMSTYFRLLNRRGGYTWMQMCATLVCNTKNDQEQSIICVNYVLSGSQYSHVIMDKQQVDQPLVRVKHDAEESLGTGAETVSGSPDSCRGESGIMTSAEKLICEGG